MQVEFQYSPDDLKVIQRELPWRLRWGFRLAVPLMVLLSAVPGAVLLLASGAWQVAGSGFAIYLALISVPVLRGMRTAQRIDEKLCRPRTLSVSPEGLRVESDDVSARCSWEPVRRIQVTDTHVILFCGTRHFHAIRSTAFESEQHLQRFVELARQFKEQWQQHEDAQAAADQPAPEQAAAVAHVSYWNRGNRASYSFSTILVFFFVYVLLSFWLFGNTHARTPLALLGGSLLYCMHAFWGLIPLISGVDIFIRLMSGQVTRRRTSLAIRHDGLLSEERDGVTLNRWSWVEPLQLQQQHVYVYVTRNEPLHVIPLRAFGGRTAAEQFVQTANQLRLERLADHDDDSALPPVIAQETGNPYQPPQT